MSSPVVQVRARVPRIAGAAVQRARLTVVPRRRTRTNPMPFVALVSMLLLGGVVGLLLFNTSMQQASFAATALEEQATTLSARQQTLEMELDGLRDPQRIATAAQRLGMVQACSTAFLRLGSRDVVGKPCAATAAPFPIRPPAPHKPAALDPKPQVVVVPPSPADTRLGSAAGSAAGASATGRNGHGSAPATPQTRGTR